MKSRFTFVIRLWLFITIEFFLENKSKLKAFFFICETATSICSKKCNEQLKANNPENAIHFICLIRTLFYSQ